MNYKPYIDAFSALLTPLIAIIAIYIAYQQHRTNKIRLQHDLFEKQFGFYLELMQFIVLAKAHPITDEQMTEVHEVFMKAEFFFNKNVSAHVKEIQIKAITKKGIERKMKTAAGEDLDNLKTQLNEVEKWFDAQIRVTHRKFKKHLKLR